MSIYKLVGMLITEMLIMDRDFHDHLLKTNWSRDG